MSGPRFGSRFGQRLGSRLGWRRPAGTGAPRTFAVHPREPEHRGGLSRPAELASLASRAENGGTTAIEFEVVHRSEDAPGHDGTGAAPGAGTRPPGETLGFSAAGARVDVTTWPAVSADVAISHELSESAVLGGRPRRLEGGAGWAFRGSAVLNPGFLTDRSRTLDVLLSLGGAPWVPTYRDTLMLTRALRLVTHFATETGLPVLSMTSPAAPSSEAVGTTRGDGSGERLRGPFAPCVRLSLGLDADRPAARLAFEANLARFATETGLSLRIGDRRSGRGRGEWFAITAFRASLYRDGRDELFGYAPDRPPAEALWVTVLGPARVGASVTMLRRLERSNVGCLGVAGSVLQDIWFANLLLPVAPARTGEPTAGPGAGRASEGFGPVASRCGLTTRQGADGGPAEGDGHPPALDMRSIADHLLLVSDPMPCRFEPRSRSGPPATLPVWVSWDMPASGVESRDVLRAVLDGLAPHAESVQVAFTRASRGDRGRLLGRAKLAVTPAADRRAGTTPGSLGEMAARAQDAASRRLAAQLAMNPADIRVQVAWRERWLSHLAAP